MMSFICLDADSHRLIALLGDRFNRTIKNFFIAHYSLAERTRVQTVTLDMTIATLKRHKVAVLAAVTSPYSNGPIEGANRLIKSLKRSCFGFKNQLNFFKRIYQITA